MRWSIVPMVLFAPAAAAGTTVIGNGSAQVWAGAGMSPGNTVDTVQFTVPGGSVGDGAPVAGTEAGQSATLVDARGRAPGRGRTVIWTVDSSVPLQCATPASCGTTTIPMSRLRWSVSGGNEVADASFDGSTNQLLHTFRTSRYVAVYKTFYFVNDELVPAGRYTGRVVYTVSMP